MSLAVNEHPWGLGSPVLADLESICWQMLYDATTNRKNAMHQAVIATAVDGVAHMRTVVLRRVDAGSKKHICTPTFEVKKWWTFKKPNISAGLSTTNHKEPRYA